MLNTVRLASQPTSGMPFRLVVLALVGLALSACALGNPASLLVVAGIIVIVFAAYFIGLIWFTHRRLRQQTC